VCRRHYVGELRAEYYASSVINLRLMLAAAAAAAVRGGVDGRPAGWDVTRQAQMSDMTD